MVPGEGMPLLVLSEAMLTVSCSRTRLRVNGLWDAKPQSLKSRECHPLLVLLLLLLLWLSLLHKTFQAINYLVGIKARFTRSAKSWAYEDSWSAQADTLQVTVMLAQIYWWVNLTLNGIAPQTVAQKNVWRYKEATKEALIFITTTGSLQRGIFIGWVLWSTSSSSSLV